MIKHLLFMIIPTLFFSCGNEVEEITDPKTGTVLKKYEYYLDDNGQKVKDGTSSEWYANGDIRLTQNFEDGKRVGESIFYKSQDSIHVNNYVDDELDGECVLKNSKNIILSKYHYSKGILDGRVEYNYSDGNKHIIGQFEDGLQTGKWSYFNELGKEVATLNFKNGSTSQVIGKWMINDDPKSYFIFREDGTYSLFEPYNKYSTTSYELQSGGYSIGNGFSMEVVVELQQRVINCNLEYFDGKKMLLTYKNIRWDLTKAKS